MKELNLLQELAVLFEMELDNFCQLENNILKLVLADGTIVKLTAKKIA